MELGCLRSGRTKRGPYVEGRYQSPLTSTYSLALPRRFSLTLKIVNGRAVGALYQLYPRHGPGASISADLLARERICRICHQSINRNPSFYSYYLDCLLTPLFDFADLNEEENAQNQFEPYEGCAHETEI